MNCRKDKFGNIQQIENRAILREVYIPDGIEQLSIVDSLCLPLVSHTVLYDSYRMIISLDHWRHQKSIRLLADKTNTSSYLTYAEDGYAVFDFGNSHLCDVSICTNQGTVVLSREELCSFLTDMPNNHNDGIIIKPLPNSSSHDCVEFHILIIAPHRSQIYSFDHQFLHSISHLYRPIETPLLLGHRGCGMNSEWRDSDSPVVENTIDSFQKAWDRGLHGVEFDVQLSHDSEVVVFHDYTIRIGLIMS